MKILSVFFCLFVSLSIIFAIFVVEAKSQPSSFDRNWRCPIRSSSIPSSFFPSQANLNNVTVDTKTLGALFPAIANNFSNIAIIKIKRDRQTGVPYFSYFGNGHEKFAVETWSSSKVFAAMNAAGHLGDACSTKVGGIFESTQGQFSPITPLGDLVTIIVTYDTQYYPPYSSNSLGGWMNVAGGRKRARDWFNNPATSWLYRPGESLGANYGESPPTDLKFVFQNPGPCAVQPDTYANDGNANTISALTAAELVKRIVFARELPQAQLFPGTTWQDSQTLLYGAARSVLFENSSSPFRQWGGMSANLDDLFRLGLNMTLVEEKSKGLFRTFSKGGDGYSLIRLAGEELFNGYVCLPDFSNSSDPNFTEDGVEFIVSARVSVPGDTKLEIASQRMVDGMTALNEAFMSGKL